MSQQSYRKLISGESRGTVPLILRGIAAVGSVVYGLVISLRNLAYSKGWLKTYNAKAPVISVGNITTGGTGKTPLVIWLCNYLHSKNIKCAILTRGYKTTQRPEPKTQNYTDEPGTLAESCPEAILIVNPNRLSGAAKAVGQLGAQILVMDDGFQHRRLRRDLDIVTIDATEPFGYGRLLPAGLLREPLTALRRADAVVVTRVDQCERENLDKLEQKLKSVNPDLVIARSIHSPSYVRLTDGRQSDAEQLKGKKAFAFCGIGNPDAFFRTLKSISLTMVGSKAYNDHYRYTEADIADIYKEAEQLGAEMVLTTQKDWTKIFNRHLPISRPCDIIFGYLAVELKIIAGKEKIMKLIELCMRNY